MTTEPVVLTELARAVIVALVALGWITLDNTTVNFVASAIGVLLSGVLSWIARGRVTPMPPSSVDRLT